MLRLLSSLLLIFLFFTAPSFAMNLKERMLQAKKGDYLVTLHDRTYTFFHIYDFTNNLFTIEEISISENEWNKQQNTWKQWLEQGAKGNQSWVLYELDQATGEIIEYYSFTRKGWIDIHRQENFLPLLLNINFQKVPDEKRQKIGIEPEGGPDMRRNWQPPLIFEGKKIKPANFDAWVARWPKDDSPLSGKEVQIYLPVGNELVPAYYPYWLQISNDVGKAHIRVVDTGKGAHSPQEDLPRRSPQFTADPTYQGGKLVLSFKAPSYFKEFSLFAYSKQKEFIFPEELSAQFQQKKGNEWEIILSKEELKKTLEVGRKYIFVLAIKDHPELFVETKPFHWKGF